MRLNKMALNDKRLNRIILNRHQDELKRLSNVAENGLLRDFHSSHNGLSKKIQVEHLLNNKGSIVPKLPKMDMMPEMMVKPDLESISITPVQVSPI